jgi:membrane protease YdiL (CAAX protease family)
MIRIQSLLMSGDQRLDYLPVEPSSSATRWPGYVAWAVIWSLVLYLMLSAMLPQLRGKAVAMGTSDAQMELVGKYVVGATRLTRSASTQPAGPDAGGLLVSQLDPMVHSDRNRLQAAAIAGEVLGADAALKRLDAIKPASVDPEVRDSLETLRRIYTGGPPSVGAEAAQKLETNLGFSGKLAMTYGQADDSPARSTILAHARRVAVVFGGAIAVGGLALLLGVVLLVVGLVLLSTGVLRWLYKPATRFSTVFVEMFAIYLGSFFLISLLLTLVMHGSTSLGMSWILTLVLPIAIGWGLWRGLSWDELRMGLGWHGGRGWYIEIPLGVVGYIAGLPIVALGFVITLLLIRLTNQTPSHPIQSEEVGTALSALQLYGIAALWAPVLEETMFRGALFHHMRQRWGWVISAGLVAFIFAAIHPQGWATIPVLGSIALVLAALREWRGSILASMTAHACNNFIMVSLLLATK